MLPWGYPSGSATLLYQVANRHRLDTVDMGSQVWRAYSDPRCQNDHRHRRERRSRLVDIRTQSSFQCPSGCASLPLGRESWHHPSHLAEVGRVHTLTCNMASCVQKPLCRLRVGQSTAKCLDPLHYTLVPLPGHAYIPTPAT